MTADAIAGRYQAAHVARLPLDLELLPSPIMVGGLEVYLARVTEPGRRRCRRKLYIAARKGSDLHAGRGGFGRSRDEAVTDLLRYLRDRYLPDPL
jgi:hypothetical protein